MFGAPKTMQPNEEIFILSCELVEITEKITDIQESMERLGVSPHKADISKGRNPRWRKKVLGLIREANELVQRGETLRTRLYELGVPVEE